VNEVIMDEGNFTFKSGRELNKSEDSQTQPISEKHSWVIDLAKNGWVVTKEFKDGFSLDEQWIFFKFADMVVFLREQMDEELKEFQQREEG